MKIDQVPKEGNKTHRGLNKAAYAVDGEGNYKLVQTPGWDVEETVTMQAVEEFERLVEEATAEYAAGKASALKVHMYRSRMDLPMLAQATGLCRWRVKRHLKPKVFAKLGEKILGRYAEVLNMEVEALRKID